MEAAGRNLERLTSELDRAERANAERLQEEYQRLLRGLTAAQPENSAAASALTSSPALADDELREAMPGNMRKAAHFLGVMRRLLAHVRQKMRSQIALLETPLAARDEVRRAIAVEPKALRCCSRRLASLLQTLAVRDIEQYTPIALLADFATLLGTYQQGFLLVLEPFDERTPTVHDPVLQFW